MDAKSQSISKERQFTRKVDEFGFQSCRHAKTDYARLRLRPHEESQEDRTNLWKTTVI